ncbi:unnamed protein product [Prunus armeniaca]
MEDYIDDMLVNASRRANHIKNLAESFSLLQNLIRSILGYLVTQRGIEAHPNQIKLILNMKSLATMREIQSLMGITTTLNRFLSRSTYKCRPFFKALMKGQRDKWDEECEVAFQNLKTYLTSPPLLSKPVPGEELFIYLVVSNLAISLALIREELGAQSPVETHYQKIDRLILSLVVSARKLRPYYQAYQIIVMT